jgi:hypothetical protein
MYQSTYHEAIAVLQQNVSNAAIALEEALQVLFTGAIGQATNVDSGAHHSAIRRAK